MLILQAPDLYFDVGMVNYHHMSEFIILGSSALFPLPRTESNRFEDYADIANYQKHFPLHDDPLCEAAKVGGKDRRTRACLALSHNGKRILFDAGPDILFQLKRAGLGKPDAFCITHAHPDANFGLRNFSGVPVFSESLGTMRADQPFELFGLSIFPFRVQHAENTPTVGFRIQLPGNKNIIYASDFHSLRGLKDQFQKADLALVDGSILRRSLNGHLSIVSQLKAYKRWQVRRVLFTHIGHATLPHEQLRQFVRGRLPDADVAYDGLKIKM